MSDTQTAELRTVQLDTPIVRGEQKIAFLQVRKPKAGELRGLSLVDIGQLKVDALIKLLPRICSPVITEADAANMDLCDQLAVGAEIGTFLLQRSKQADAQLQ